MLGRKATIPARAFSWNSRRRIGIFKKTRQRKSERTKYWELSWARYLLELAQNALTEWKKFNLVFWENRPKIGLIFPFEPLPKLHFFHCSNCVLVSSFGGKKPTADKTTSIFGSNGNTNKNQIDPLLYRSHCIHKFKKRKKERKKETIPDIVPDV